ncbi:carcinoembryonic antigen-related cell adhesion molecule 5-like isoform X2 [Megalobrama amblycephala]|uniref:carcinoembryonic antigen-related cell adhesion molecule 5-like isoform X2 n=1 Tax=Megalobrama amblycephala TaxID=75352 RepID=UPI00201403D4|nr:carcinoembryonic antigen-related cell adhesion molecule 5-like isoform X2 [Megalobrama amblycephala]
MSCTEDLVSRNISCSPGESVLLHCRDENSKHKDVQWQRTDIQEKQNPVSVKDQRYKDRVQIHGNLSLSITRLTVDDAGSYWCNSVKQVDLLIEGCSLSANEASESISRYSGESVFLSCLVKCSARYKPDKIRWKLPNNREINQTTNSTELNPLYQGRFHMFGKQTGNFSLLIPNLTEKYEGLYSCWINESQHKSFNLTVKGCALSETEREPKTKYPGDSVLLSCSCKDPKSKPEAFRWTHLDSNVTEVSNETLRYRARVHMFNKTTPSNLSLLISNLTEDDQGIYRCTVNNKTSTRTSLTVKGCVLSKHPNITKNSYAGESVTLPCSCEDPKTKPKHVEWKLAALNETLISDSKDVSGRFQILRDSPHNLSLRISNLTETDGGLYVCTVNGKQSRSINLTVTGCVLSEHPNTIISYAGESVTLPCSCEDPKTKPKHVEWKRAALNETLVSDSKDVSGRFQILRDSPHNLSLRISNLTETDGGLYVCTVNGKQSRRINLTVTDFSKSLLKYSLMFLICLTLLLLTGFICWRYAQAKKGRRGTRVTQRPDHQDDVTYSTVMKINRGKPAENQQQDDVTYSSIKHIKEGKRTCRKEEEVVYSTMADVSNGRSAQDDVTYSSVVCSKFQKPRSLQMNTEEAVVYASVQKDKT